MPLAIRPLGLTAIGGAGQRPYGDTSMTEHIEQPALLDDLDTLNGTPDLAMQTEWQGVTQSGNEWNVYLGDAGTVLRDIPSASINCVVTSPPYYWLRDYGADGQLGLEDTIDEYVTALMRVMDHTYRILRDDGVLFLNMGDTYYSGKGQSRGTDTKNKKRRFGLRAVDKSGGLGIGLKHKSAIGVPWRVALAMCHRGWTLRSPIIWNRQHCLPENVEDRPRRSYEFVFLFSKTRQYYFNRAPLIAAGEEDIWTITARPEGTVGLATAPYPDELVQRCLDIGCPEGGKVLDPFAGSGTTLRVALTSGRDAVGIDLNRDFCEHMVRRLESL